MSIQFIVVFKTTLLNICFKTETKQKIFIIIETRQKNIDLNLEENNKFINIKIGIFFLRTKSLSINKQIIRQQQKGEKKKRCFNYIKSRQL